MASIAILTSLGLLFGAGCERAAAQTSQPGAAELIHLDVIIKVVNGTTGEPGHAQTVSLTPARGEGRALDTASDVTGTVTFRGLEISPFQQYLAEAVAEGVPYYAPASGRKLADTLTVYVFSTTTELAGVRVTGMNLVARRVGDLLELEYLWTLNNEARPQQTVMPEPATLELAWPQGSEPPQAEVISRPQSAELATVPGRGGQWIGLVAPLPPGSTQLRVTGRIEYPGNAQVPVGANLAVQDWSLLVFPTDLGVTGPALADVTPTKAGDYSRLPGVPLAAGAASLLDFSGGTVPGAGELRAEGGEAAPGQEVPVEEPLEKTRSLSLIWVLIFVVLVVLYFLLRRRRP
jgi:hypothetical protein